MKHTDALCPLCSRPVRTGRGSDFTFIDCRHCSHYRIDAAGMLSLYANRLPPDQVAAIASYNWEWPTCELNAINVRNMGRFWLQDEHHRFCRVLLPVLYNTYRQEHFTLSFDDPMLLGCTASQSPIALRAFVTGPGRDSYLPIFRDHGHSIETVVTDHAMVLLNIPVTIAPGIAHAINLDALRKRVA